MSETSALVIFDFDKTLVARDSFRLLGDLGASGRGQRLLFLALAALSKIRLLSNRRYKELVLDRVWRRRSPRQRDEILIRLLDSLRSLTIEPSVAALQDHLQRGDTVAVVTASPEFYVAEFMAQISDAVRVRGSRVVESDKGLHVSNLRGERKAVAGAELISESGAEIVHVYTDHADDLPLMKLANRITLVDPPQATIAAADRAGLDYEILAT